LKSVQPFNSQNSLCISPYFSPPSSIFNFEKHCFQLIISHYVTFHRFSYSCLKTKSFRRFSLWCSINSWNRESISPVTSHLAALLSLKKIRSHLPHNTVDSLTSWIESWNSHLNS
jgi:hypothetical protein